MEAPLDWRCVTHAHPSAIAASPFRKWFLFMAEIGMLRRFQRGTLRCCRVHCCWRVEEVICYRKERRKEGDLVNQELYAVWESCLAGSPTLRQKDSILVPHSFILRQKGNVPIRLILRLFLPLVRHYECPFRNTDTDNNWTEVLESNK